MNIEKLISVIIPTYKRPDLLNKAIESVKKQTYKNVEIIVVDDNEPGSIYREETENKISSHLNKNLIYIKHEKNRGGCAARNTGIKNSRGDYIAFLDDDDIWLPDKLERQLKLFKQNDNLGIVYCHRYSFKENGRIYRKKKSKLVKGYVFNEMLIHNYISTPVALVKRECFNKVGLFDERFKSRQDHDMFLRICKHYEVDYIDGDLVGMLVHTDRISRNIENKIQGWNLFMEKWKKELDEDQLRLLKIAYHNALGKNYYINSDFKSARKHFKTQIKCEKKNLKVILLYFLSFLKVKIIK